MPPQLWDEASRLRVLALSRSFCQMISPCPQLAAGREKRKRWNSNTSFTTWDCLDFLSVPLTSAPAENPFHNVLPQIPFFFGSTPSLMMPHSFTVLYLTLLLALTQTPTPSSLDNPTDAAHSRSNRTRWHISFCTFLLANFCMLGTIQTATRLSGIMKWICL